MSDSAANDAQLASHLRRFSPSPNRDPDAGLRALSHYERRLPPWRYKLRTRLIPIVRWETPYLARLQELCRSPFLDSYFAFTANLGTHTFFMTFLPICFWCGHPDLGIALTHMLALGVSLSGALKDLVCLPRPLSPPLQRITMSGSAALEYGFPSTHTTNAVSVAVFGLYQLHLAKADFSPLTYELARLGYYFYATSIALGRVYCGMHGFFDIPTGATLGAAVAWFRIRYGNAIDIWLIEGSWLHPALVVAVLALAVRFHPEPADNCPCFDDSVAFLGVLMGTSIGTWHLAKSQGLSGSSVPLQSLAPLYEYANTDIFKAAARLVGGVIAIFLWRAIMKPFLLKSLPSIFRFIDHWGVNMPRRYFLQARDYKAVPPLRKDDNVLPSASDIPSMLSSSFRHPRRRRISVGPQSEADARELLANRQHERNKSRSRSSRSPPGTKSDSSVAEDGGASSDGKSSSAPPALARSDGRQKGDLLAPPMPAIHVSDEASRAKDAARDKEDHRMLSALEKPRTHYDVEVVTKLVVYAGIAWLATEGNPLWFAKLGLT
ncbi:phosphatidic acid phosphatase type 2/haloperoxidase [Neohortaea acidophila]|uniref:Phosphatidic acid phosphatase type 2/haloperoxidase n=1 Tax=Neohortaea acidophila TaxID=245834 RepID=A0A6A6PT69_9PEZI|nr:phosphatidic acid phosphatase type 2/haloperoxidase [Neohortaea acidophila]KAF2482966.1 phosphatidic acid phosphatase type 2/haloperoxidase [Neohortaea acidophila]